MTLTLRSFVYATLLFTLTCAQADIQTADNYQQSMGAPNTANIKNKNTAMQRHRQHYQQTLEANRRTHRARASAKRSANRAYLNNKKHAASNARAKRKMAYNEQVSDARFAKRRKRNARFRQGREHGVKDNSAKQHFRRGRTSRSSINTLPDATKRGDKANGFEAQRFQHLDKRTRNHQFSPRMNSHHLGQGRGPGNRIRPGDTPRQPGSAVQHTMNPNARGRLNEDRHKQSEKDFEIQKQFRPVPPRPAQ